MKCQSCSAKLMPVSGQMFCLQCGNVYELDGVTVVYSSQIKVSEELNELSLKARNDGRSSRDIPNNDHASKPKPEPPSAQPIKPSGEPRVAEVKTQKVTITPQAQVTLAHAISNPVDQQTNIADQPVLNQTPSVTLDKNITSVVHETSNIAKNTDVGVVRRAMIYCWNRPWLIGIALFLIFLVSNFVVMAVWSNRVYPGVKLGTLDIGGKDKPAVSLQLTQLASLRPLQIHQGSRMVELTTSSYMKLDSSASIDAAIMVGRNQALPIFGLLSSWLAPPVSPKYEINATALETAVAEVARQLDVEPHDAAVIVHNGKSLLLSEKPGISIHQEELRKAIFTTAGKVHSLNASYQELTPQVRNNDVAAAHANAQQILDLRINLKQAAKTYSPTAAEIGTWIYISDAGRSIQPDVGRIGAYLAGIPEKYDRAEALLAISQAMLTKTSLDLTLNTKRQTLVSAQPTYAMAPITYRYCVAGVNQQDLELGRLAKVILSSKQGWSLGGSVVFELRETACDLAFSVRNVVDITTLSPKCARLTTCEIGNELAVSQAAWNAPPQTWKVGAERYREELFNHVLGQWLGFDHALCDKPATTPLISEPAVILESGCSPEWYAVPPEIQSSSILAGF